MDRYGVDTMKMRGWVILPCFKVEIDESGECNFIGSRFAETMFEVFFAPFWTGKIHITEVEK